MAVFILFLFMAFRASYLAAEYAPFVDITSAPRLQAILDVFPLKLSTRPEYRDEDIKKWILCPVRIEQR